MTSYDVIVIGGGAAGLMCALRAGQRGRRVVLLEHTDTLGAKILISGGGRCNFTNRDVRPERFLSQNPHFCISALKSYTQHDFIALVQKHHIPFHEKTLGQLFCDLSANDILAMLIAECKAVHVTFKLDCQISSITKSDVFDVQTSSGLLCAASVVLATGGLSIPKMGATGFAYDVAQRFQLPMTERRPGLVPLTFEGETLSFLRPLSGMSLEVTTSYGGRSFREGMVMTHRGLSGPAVLQISSYWRDQAPIAIDLAPDISLDAFFLERKKTRPKAEFKTVLSEVLPHRLASALTTAHHANDSMANMADKTLKALAISLKNWALVPSGTEGYAKAEVTLGGIDTAALSSKTMMAPHVPGLFFIGESVDVTGWLGGYNFQWAWSSGWAAGSAA